MQQFEEIKTIASKDYVYCLYRVKKIEQWFEFDKHIKDKDVECNFWFVSRINILPSIQIATIEWLNHNLVWMNEPRQAYAFHEKRYGLLEKFIMQSIDLKECHV